MDLKTLENDIQNVNNFCRSNMFKDMKKEKGCTINFIFLKGKYNEVVFTQKRHSYLVSHAKLFQTDRALTTVSRNSLKPELW